MSWKARKTTGLRKAGWPNELKSWFESLRAESRVPGHYSRKKMS